MRSLGLSPLLGANFTSVVSDTLDPAAVELGVAVTVGVMVAPATAGAAADRARTRASATTARRTDDGT
jgi:hypothetical protein